MSQYHDILGVGPEASEAEIKEAFRQRAFECHPDRAAEGQKEEAHREFVRLQEAFEALTKGTAPSRNEVDAESDDTQGARRRRRSYKKEWRKYKNKKIRIAKDIFQNVDGLSNEYDVVREKNRITVPVCGLVGALVVVYDPMAIYGTGFFLFDVLVCGLIGSVYGFALGSIWAYAELFFASPGSD